VTDILDLIDNATQSLCACGCGSKLPADGPSAWFAAQECQRRWNEARAIDPHDVLDREDPFIDYGPVFWDDPDGAAERLERLAAQPRRFERADWLLHNDPTPPMRIWIGGQEITDMVVPGSIRLNTSALWTRLVDSEPYNRFDDAALERIQGFRDASVTITGYWNPPPVNVHLIMDDICRWLSANRIDHRSVPIEAVPAIFGNQIFCPVYVRSRAGKMWVDRRSDSVRTKLIRARLRVPPPPVLKPWLATGSLLPVLEWAKGRLARHRMHSDYSRRLRARRRRR
jgi:hypothetical protein